MDYCIRLTTRPGLSYPPGQASAGSSQPLGGDPTDVEGYYRDDGETK